MPAVFAVVAYLRVGRSVTNRCKAVVEGVHEVSIRRIEQVRPAYLTEGFSSKVAFSTGSSFLLPLNHENKPPKLPFEGLSAAKTKRRYVRRAHEVKHKTVTFVQRRRSDFYTRIWKGTQSVTNTCRPCASTVTTPKPSRKYVRTKCTKCACLTGRGFLRGRDRLAFEAVHELLVGHLQHVVEACACATCGKQSGNRYCTTVRARFCATTQRRTHQPRTLSPRATAKITSTCSYVTLGTMTDRYLAATITETVRQTPPADTDNTQIENMAAK